MKSILESATDLTLNGNNAGSAGEHIISGFQIQSQKMSLWCWAAVASSISQHFDGDGFLTQQQIVSAVQGKPHCNVSDNFPPDCNQTASLETALLQINHLQQAAINEPVDPDIIKQQILNNKPVGVQLAYGSGDTHFIVIYGYADFGSNLWLNVGDPQASFDEPGTKTVLYNSLLSFSNGSWSRTYLTA